MNRTIGRGVAGLLISALLIASTAASALGAGPSRVVVAYFGNWDIYDGYYPADIPASKLSHIDYAFGLPTSAGTCALRDPWADYQRPFPAKQSVDGVADHPGNPAQHLFGNFNQLRKLKQAHPGLKAIISIGGWSDSDYFSDIAATQTSRRTFVTSCINLFLKGNLPVAGGAGGSGSAAHVFDGIDIDWEYPVCCGEAGNHNRPADRHNATLLFGEFRHQLNVLGQSTGRHYLLTAAIPGGGVAGASYELAKVGATLDWINLMTYDLHGSWDDTTNFLAPFASDPADPTPPAIRATNNVRGTVGYFRARGVPANKLVVGIPFYGVQYIRVDPPNHGLYQAFDNTGLDSGSGWTASSNPTYRELVDVGRVVTAPTDGSTPVGRNGYHRYWNAAAGEPWLWDAATSRAGDTVSSFIGYDDRASIAERVRFIKAKGLRGGMVWEISQDSSSHDLIRELAKVLH